MAVNIHITIIELNALHTKRQNLFQELDAVIHLLMEAKHWGSRKSRNATTLNSRFKSLETVKFKKISVKSRREIRTNNKKASKIGSNENKHLGGGQSDGYFLDKLEPIPSALPSFQKLFQVSARSEERRVGKECRSGWSPYHKKKKKKKTERVRGTRKKRKSV